MPDPEKTEGCTLDAHEWRGSPAYCLWCGVAPEKAEVELPARPIIAKHYGEDVAERLCGPEMAEDDGHAACEWCGRAIYSPLGSRDWLAVKGVERGYDPLYCDANDEDGRHEPPENNPSGLPEKAEFVDDHADCGGTWCGPDPQTVLRRLLAEEQATESNPSTPQPDGREGPYPMTDQSRYPADGNDASVAHDERLTAAREEIIRREALIDGATSGPWKGTRLGRLGGRLAVVVSTEQPPKRGYGGQFVLADSDPEARVEDAHFIAANDPSHAAAMLRLASLILDRHARTHTCVMRWTDDGAEVGQYIWPVLLCADVKPVLDLYAPVEAS